MRKPHFWSAFAIMAFAAFALPASPAQAGFPTAALATAPDYTQPDTVDGIATDADLAIQDPRADLQSDTLQLETADSQAQEDTAEPRLLLVGQEVEDYSNTAERRLAARQQASALQRRFGSLNRMQLPGFPGNETRTRATPVSGESSTAQGWSLWSDNNISHLKDTLAASASSGPSLSFTVGLDRAINDSLTLGASLNYLNTDLNTYYNNGTKRTHAYAASLYLHYQLLQWLAVEMQGGYVHQQQKISFNLAGGGVAKGNRNANGYMLTASLNAARWFDRMLLSARAGIIATRDRWNTLNAVDVTTGILALSINSHTESLLQGAVEAGVSYWLDPVMPYFNISYAYDLARKTTSLATDRDDFTLTAGMAWYPPGELEGFSLDISGSAVLGRSGQHNYTAALGLKWSW